MITVAPEDNTGTNRQMRPIPPDLILIISRTYLNDYDHLAEASVLPGFRGC